MGLNKKSINISKTNLGLGQVANLSPAEIALLAGSKIDTGLSEKSKVEVGSMIESAAYKEVTYTELLELTHSSKLNPGSLYRLTDYKFMGNVDYSGGAIASIDMKFDILLMARSKSELFHEAHILPHEGVDYEGRDLSRFKILYNLENDKTKFDWAYNYVEKITGFLAKDIFYSLTDENLIQYQLTNVLDPDEFEMNYEWTRIDSEGVGSKVYTYPNPSEGSPLKYEDGTISEVINLYENVGATYIQFIRSVINDPEEGTYPVAWKTQSGVERIVYTLDEDLRVGTIAYSTPNGSKLGSVVVRSVQMLDSHENDGRGVIYYMKDDRGNEAPFDSINVRFIRLKVKGFDHISDRFNNSAWVGNYLGIPLRVDPYQIKYRIHPLGFLCDKYPNVPVESVLHAPAFGPNSYNNKIEDYWSSGLRRLPNVNIEGDNNVVGPNCDRVTLLDCYNCKISSGAKDVQIIGSANRVTVEGGTFIMITGGSGINIGYGCHNIFVNIKASSVDIGPTCMEIGVNGNSVTVLGGTKDINVSNNAFEAPNGYVHVIKRPSV